MLSVGEDCQSLNKVFCSALKLLQTKEGISEAVYLVQEELKAEGLSYAELRLRLSYTVRADYPRHR